MQDGRNYSRRTVSAKQNDGTIFKSVVSFQVKTENTIFHQVDIPSDAPKPEDLLTMVEVEEKCECFLNIFTVVVLCMTGFKHAGSCVVALCKLMLLLFNCIAVKGLVSLHRLKPLLQCSCIRCQLWPYHSFIF